MYLSVLPKATVNVVFNLMVFLSLAFNFNSLEAKFVCLSPPCDPQAMDPNWWAKRVSAESLILVGDAKRCTSSICEYNSISDFVLPYSTQAALNVHYSSNSTSFSTISTSILRIRKTFETQCEFYTYWPKKDVQAVYLATDTFRPCPSDKPNKLSDVDICSRLSQRTFTSYLTPHREVIRWEPNQCDPLETDCVGYWCTLKCCFLGPSANPQGRVHHAAYTVSFGPDFSPRNFGCLGRVKTERDEVFIAFRNRLSTSSDYACYDSSGIHGIVFVSEDGRLCEEGLFEDLSFPPNCILVANTPKCLIAGSLVSCSIPYCKGCLSNGVVLGAYQPQPCLTPCSYYFDGNYFCLVADDIHSNATKWFPDSVDGFVPYCEGFHTLKYNFLATGFVTVNINMVYDHITISCLNSANATEFSNSTVCYADSVVVEIVCVVKQRLKIDVFGTGYRTRVHRKCDIPSCSDQTSNDEIFVQKVISGLNKFTVPFTNNRLDFEVSVPKSADLVGSKVVYNSPNRHLALKSWSYESIHYMSSCVPLIPGKISSTQAVTGSCCISELVPSTRCLIGSSCKMLPTNSITMSNLGAAFSVKMPTPLNADTYLRDSISISDKFIGCHSINNTHEMVVGKSIDAYFSIFSSIDYTQASDKLSVRVASTHKLTYQEAISSKCLSVNCTQLLKACCQCSTDYLIACSIYADSPTKLVTPSVSSLNGSGINLKSSSSVCRVGTGFTRCHFALSGLPGQSISIRLGDCVTQLYVGCNVIDLAEAPMWTPDQHFNMFSNITRDYSWVDVTTSFGKLLTSLQDYLQGSKLSLAELIPKVILGIIILALLYLAVLVLMCQVKQCCRKATMDGVDLSQLTLIPYKKA